MKKYYLLSILAVILGFSLSSAAQNKVNFVWDNPDAVRIFEGSMESEALPISAGATSYELTYSPGSFFICPGEGYVITKLSVEGSPQNQSVGKNYTYGQQTSIYLGSSHNGKTITIETKKLEDDGVLNLNVINGAEYVTATLQGSWKDADNINYEYARTIDLSDGTQEIKYPTAYIKEMTISLRKGLLDEIHSVKKNGETVAGNSYMYTYDVYMKDIKSGDNIEVQVYEGDAPKAEKCIVTLDLAPGLEDCIMNIRDWKINEFVQPVDGKVEVLRGTDLQLNFNEGYTFTKFTVGDEDVTSTYNESAQKLRFNVTEDVTVKIEGTAIVYGDVEFTVYVMNPEGVLLTKEVYGSLANALDPEEGTPITSEITLPENSFTDKVGNITTYKGAVMTPENTRMFKIKVSERRPLAYLRPAIGLESVADQSPKCVQVDDNSQIPALFPMAQSRGKCLKVC